MIYLANRIKWIDVAKGIGIILVVYGHVLRGLVGSSVNINNIFFEINDKLIYGFHMPLFFILSGLFVERSKNIGIKSTVKIKSIQLLIPYFVWSIAQGLINVILSSITNNSMSITEVFIRTLINPFGQFWFLYVLFLIFVLYYLLRSKFSISYILSLSIFLYIIAPFVDFWIFNQLFINLFFFVLGSYLFQKNILDNLTKLNKLNWYFIFSISTFIIVNYFYLFYKFPLILEHILLLLVSIIGINLIISISLVVIKKNIPIISRFFTFLGERSIVIYLAHILAASGTRIILSGFLGIYNPIIQTILGTCLGIILPLILYKITTKVNINNYVFGEKKKIG